eukprot:scaffold71_cov247-Pinguiococcus_pyrenoidosus.AAC.34
MTFNIDVKSLAIASIGRRLEYGIQSQGRNHSHGGHTDGASRGKSSSFISVMVSNFAVIERALSCLADLERAAQLGQGSAPARWHGPVKGHTHGT